MSLTYYLCCTGFVEKVRFESLNLEVLGPSERRVIF